MTVLWEDFLGTTHSVTVGVNQVEQVNFPLVNSSWNWLDGDGWERTGFNGACKWVQATFLGKEGRGWPFNEDNYVRI